jgi:DNA-binding GntR family transcriptional regulator
MERIKAENLSHKVAEIISEQIIRKDLLPGERLIEVKIARELGVSQSTIREAFRTLEKKKMVTIQARRGTIVTKLDQSYVESIYDILAELYALAMQKAMTRGATPADIEDTVRAMEKIKVCVEAEDGIGYGEAMFEMATILLRAAKDPLLEHIVTELWQVKRWIEYKVLLFRKKDLLDSYMVLKNILEAAANGQGSEAARMIREQTQYEKMIALKVIGDPSMPEDERQ